MEDHLRPDTPDVSRLRWHQVTNAVRQRIPKLAQIMEGSCEDDLAYTAKRGASVLRQALDLPMAA